MSKKSGYESRQNYYRHLIRPDGSLLSEKDCLLLDLCIQWTKNNNIATSTYKYLLDEKFIRQNHPKTVKRTFDNISLYITGVFKNIHLINGVIHKDKIRIERAADFDLKMEEAKQKNQTKISEKGVQECPPSLTQMSTMVDKNVHPYIYNDNKENNKDNNDNCDNQIIVADNENNQEIISCNFGDLIINEESVTTSQQENHFRDCYSSSITSAETLLSSSKTIFKDGIPRKRVKGLDGKMHYAIPLAKFKFDNEALDQIIYVSSREEFNRNDVVNIIKNILKKQPDKLIYGGRNGFIQYMIKAVEREYGIKKGNLDNKTNTTEYINQIRIEAMNTTLEQGNEIRWL